MSLFQRKTIRFHKMHGSGNDFILLDNRDLQLNVNVLPAWAEKLCRRKFGIGADGLILLDDQPTEAGCDYRWHFYNSDGSRAEMCGNGARCAGQLAYQLGLAGKEHTLQTDAGPIPVNVLDDETVKVRLSSVDQPELNIRVDIRTPLAEEVLNVHFINTGVPHAVIILDDVATANVNEIGRAVRSHPHFSPSGTNVNFVQVIDSENIRIRTYERGVEDETYACGTGMAAALVVAHALGLTGMNVEAVTGGGDVLQVSQEHDKVFLQGKAVLVYSGDFYPAAMGLDE